MLLLNLSPVPLNLTSFSVPFDAINSGNFKRAGNSPYRTTLAGKADATSCKKFFIIGFR